MYFVHETKCKPHEMYANVGNATKHKFSNFKENMKNSFVCPRPENNKECDNCSTVENWGELTSKAAAKETAIVTLESTFTGRGNNCKTNKRKTRPNRKIIKTVAA